MGCTSSSAVARVGDIDVIPSVPEASRSDAYIPQKSASRSFHSQYALEEKLGQGCFGRVYACRKVGSGSEEGFAVKVTDLKEDKDEMRERVARQEAHILKRVGNLEHCCRFVESMSSGRFHYIVLERCSMPLGAALDGAPELTELGLAGLVRQMFAAAACVHSVDVVHRDLKPDNFLCSGPEMTVKLCDFGLAEVVRAGSPGVAGQFGTPPFMSPEIFRDNVAGTPTDVWSLGVSLYTLVVGQFPYVVHKPCKALMKAAVVSGVPEPSFQCVAQGVKLSEQLLGLLRDLLRRDPAERPTAAEALEHRWFSMESKVEEQRPLHSLKDAVKSAKQVGAFSVPSVASRSRQRAPDSMDLALQELQRRHRPQGQAGLDDEDRRSCSRDRASAVCRSPSGNSSATTRASSRAGSSNSAVRSSPSDGSSSTTRSRARESTSKVRSPPSRGIVTDYYL